MRTPKRAADRGEGRPAAKQTRSGTECIDDALQVQQAQAHVERRRDLNRRSARRQICPACGGLGWELVGELNITLRCDDESCGYNRPVRRAL